jgi:hypothetical protein
MVIFGFTEILIIIIFYLSNQFILLDIVKLKKK